MINDQKGGNPTRRLIDKGLERVKGIEPSCPAWEAGVLPLNYTRRRVAQRSSPIYCQESTSSNFEFEPSGLPAAPNCVSGP